MDESMDVNPSMNPIPPRTKKYQESSSGPWIVFFRRISKPLNILQINKGLTSRYSSIKEIIKINNDKIRVVVNNLKHANDIVSSEHFIKEYKVYIPSKDVEIDGVVTEASLSVDDLLKHGVGRFKNSMLEGVKILECKQLYSVVHEEGKKVYRPSDSFRVTFAGSALPSHVYVDKIRLPVRLFVPNVMNCTNCKKFGHTATYCSNKPKCIKCEGPHKDNDCNKEIEKCIYCGNSPHDDISVCTAFKVHKDKIKLSLKARSKRTYAEMLKTVIDVPPLETENGFSNLEEPEDSDSDENSEGNSFITTQGSVKRKKSSSKLPKKTPKISSSKKDPRVKQKKSKPKTVPPGLSNSQTNPGSSTEKDNNPVGSISQPPTGLLKFSEIVEWIFSAFNISEPIKTLIMAFLPIARTFLKQLSAQWPIVSGFVSFDG
ncbi:uncharacterized protein LOC131440572 [Malaya genurostris]|uniref:uncharacterized protein LOC131440572 n=1 Tax=Malaya genurostris TaxID=325434 RepID=UPI0026F3ACE9|nr:uncharacterized protein LOC131440572 [Malaya genurostris]